MNLLRHGTWLFLASPVLTMLTLMTLSQVSAIDIDLMEIIDSLQKGTRTALLIAPLPRKGQIQFQANCQGAYTASWHLTGGFSSQSLGTFLFERTSLWVIHFATPLDDLSSQLPAVTFTSIPFQAFWRKPSLLAAPAAGSISPDDASSSSSVTQSLARVTQRTTTTSSGHTLIFIIIGVFFVLLLIGALAIYLLFKGGPKEDTKPATVKGDGASGAGGKTSAKSGKQSGGGAVQAKASKLFAKRGASAPSQVKCRRSSVKLQAASSKCRTSPGKVATSQRVSPPLKGRQSSVNNRGASPGKVGPSQGASPLKGQQSKVKSRASPGKVATSHLGSTR